MHDEEGRKGEKVDSELNQLNVESTALAPYCYKHNDFVMPRLTHRCTQMSHISDTLTKRKFVKKKKKTK